MYSALIIEDDASIRAVLKRIMSKKFGFNIYQAGDGMEGLKVLEETSPDLVLLDISMPVMNGIEFLQVIRHESKYKDIPVFILSAVNDRKLIKQMIDLGVNDYILKPMNVELVYERIQNFINAKIQQ